jgi:hypothetical protein
LILGLNMPPIGASTSTLSPAENCSKNFIAIA